MTASKELMEMRELYNKGVIADLVPLYREVDRSRELLRHTSASITFIRYHPDGNGGYDEGTIEECSDVKAAHYGLTRDDVIGSSNFVLMKNRKEAAKAREDDIWVMENKKPLIDIIEEITRPDGTKN